MSVSAALAGQFFINERQGEARRLKAQLGYHLSAQSLGIPHGYCHCER
jgi:hypothetical protein